MRYKNKIFDCLSLTILRALLLKPNTHLEGHFESLIVSETEMQFERHIKVVHNAIKEHKISIL